MTPGPAAEVFEGCITRFCSTCPAASQRSTESTKKLQSTSVLHAVSTMKLRERDRDGDGEIHVVHFLVIFIVDSQPYARRGGNWTPILTQLARHARIEGATLSPKPAKSVSSQTTCAREYKQPEKKPTDNGQWTRDKGNRDIPHMRARTGCWAISRRYE